MGVPYVPPANDEHPRAPSEGRPSTLPERSGRQAQVKTAARFHGANRLLALPIGTTPLNSDEGRMFLQQRLRLFAGVMGLVGAFALAAIILLYLVIPIPFDWHTLREEGINWHCVGVIASAIMWLSLRRGRLTTVHLLAKDGLGMALVLEAYSMMAWRAAAHAPERAAWIMMLITVCTVTARAVIVPSTPLHTAAVTGFGSVPVLALTYLTVLKHRNQFELTPIANTAFMSLWVIIALIITMLASRVIYGLRTQVAQAQRLGQYELEELIGEGGMGIVYKAKHALLRRPTAIKLLLPERSDPQLLQRFEREVQLTAMLTHPNTVNIYDYGHSADGTFYYAMEYLDGINLEQLVEEFGPQDPRRVVHVLEQVAGSLAEAHSVGLVHRDIKPANIILCRRGGVADVAKVVDFGLVKDSRQLGHGDPSLTSANSIIGTPLYLAPEGILAPDTVDARSDLYALGAVGYFLLTGQPVFTGSSIVEICIQHANSEPVLPSVRLGTPVEPSLEAVIMRCLAKKPENRPQSADELMKSLNESRVGPWPRDTAMTWWEQSASRISRIKQMRQGQRVNQSRDTLVVDFGGRANFATLPLK